MRASISWGPISPPTSDHVIGVTPFGRVLITWDAWAQPGQMELGSGDAVIDEMPGHSHGFGNGYDSVQHAMAAAQAEFDRLIGACITADNWLSPTTDLAQALHQRNELADTLGRCIMASGTLRADIDGLSGPQLLQFGDELAEVLKQRLGPTGKVPLQHERANRAYVCGPMTGLPGRNFEAFNAAAAKLRAEGWHVENPAESGVQEGPTWEDYMLYDLSRLVTCEALYLLPGWSGSRGANLEVYVARKLGLTLEFLPGAENGGMVEVSEDYAILQGRWVSAADVSNMAARMYRAMYPGSEAPTNCQLVDIVGEVVSRLQKDTVQHAAVPCQHTWASMKNDYVLSGEMCTKCGAIQA